MKKTYLAPAIDVQKFDVADVITTSAVNPPAASTTANVATNGGTVEIIAKW